MSTASSSSFENGFVLRHSSDADALFDFAARTTALSEISARSKNDSGVSDIAPKLDAVSLKRLSRVITSKSCGRLDSAQNAL